MTDTPRRSSEPALAVGLTPWPVSEGFHAFAAHGVDRIVVSEWTQKAATFLDVTLVFERAAKPPAGATGAAPLLETTLALRRHATSLGTVEIRVVPFDRSSGLATTVARAVDAIGGAGLDVLLSRAEVLWQLRCVDGPHRLLAALTGATVMAMATLAPVLFPDASTVGGVRTLRLAMEAEWARRISGA